MRSVNFPRPPGRSSTTAAAQPAGAAYPPRRPAFQYPLYMLMVMMTVTALALAPASYFVQAQTGNRAAKMAALIVMIAGPILVTILLSTAQQLLRYFRAR